MALRHCKRALLLALMCTGLTLTPSSGFAQSASFRSVDTNADGVLTFNELVAAFGRNGARRIMRSTDHNGDGRITIPELRRDPDDNARSNTGAGGSTAPRSGTDTDRDEDQGDDRDDDQGGSDDNGDAGGQDGGQDGGQNGGDDGGDDSGGGDDSDGGDNGGDDGGDDD